MSMEKYMGYRANGGKQSITEELATISIDGTLFYVDLMKHEYRQVDNPFNRMTLGDIAEEMGFTHFLYDTQTKNLFVGGDDNGDDLPAHVRIVLVPPLKDIDPIGLAKRQGLAVYPGSARPKKAQSLTTLAKGPTNKNRKIKRLGL